MHRNKNASSQTCVGQAETQTTYTCCLFSQFLSYHRVCFNMHTGLLPQSYYSCSFLLSLSLTVSDSVLLCLGQCCVSVCLINWVVYMKEVPWPSPQLILGAKHAGSQVAARAALEHTVIGSLRERECECVCVCVFVQCADVHFGVFRVTDPLTAWVGQWNIW